MTLNELKAAYEWGKETIKEMQEAGEKVPTSMYERLLELGDRIMKAEEKN